jgi:hypothetical protein
MAPVLRGAPRQKPAGPRNPRAAPWLVSAALPPARGGRCRLGRWATRCVVPWRIFSLALAQNWQNQKWGLQISARPISLDVGGADTALGSTYDDGGVQQRWTTEAATARREDPKKRESPAGSALLCFRTGTAPSRTLAGSEAPGAVWCVAMQVFVRLAEGRTIVVPGFGADDTVESFERAVHERSGGVQDARLAYGCKQLAAGRTLGDYNMQEGSTVEQLVRLRGGGVRPRPCHSHQRADARLSRLPIVASLPPLCAASAQLG